MRTVHSCLIRLSLTLTLLTILAVGHGAASPWHDPALQKRIDDGIEKNRKGDGAIQVVDAAGKPVAGARVELTQTGHEFLFGCNAFVLGQLKSAEENQRYEAAFTKLFNFATVPFYWEGTEPTRGELRYQEAGSRDIWRRPPPERFLAFAAKYGVTLKGHPLLWHSYNPAWLPKNAEELKALYLKRFQEIASRFGDKLAIWDVVNEALESKSTYPLYTPDHAYVGWAFDQAVPLFPKKNTMMINEVTTMNFVPADKNPFLAQVKKLLAEGRDVRGIGLQWHYFRRAALDVFLKSAKNNPAALLNLYEAFSKLGLPLYITEITIPSAGERGEALQAELVRDHYRLWFSVPAMAGITWWNLGDGTAVKGENEAQGGLMDGELKPKAAYLALDELINKEWKTRAQAQTDAQGRAGFRGFFGKYKVKVTSGGKTREFEIAHSARGSQDHRLTLKD